MNKITQYLLSFLFFAIILFGCSSGIENQPNENPTDEKQAFLKDSLAENYYSIHPFSFDRSRRVLSELETFVSVTKQDSSIKWTPVLKGHALKSLTLERDRTGMYTLSHTVEDEGSMQLEITNYFVSKDLILQKRMLRDLITDDILTFDVVHFRQDAIQKFAISSTENFSKSYTDLLDTAELKQIASSYTTTQLYVEKEFVSFQTKHKTDDEFDGHISEGKIDIFDLGFSSDNISNTAEAIFWLYLILDL